MNFSCSPILSSDDPWLEYSMMGQYGSDFLGNFLTEKYLIFEKATT